MLEKHQMEARHTGKLQDLQIAIRPPRTSSRIPDDRRDASNKEDFAPSSKHLRSLVREARIASRKFGTVRLNYCMALTIFPAAQRCAQQRNDEHDDSRFEN
jgi:hypothetical protein